MTNNKLLTIVTMLLISGVKAGAQQVSIDELRTIERLIVQKDCTELYRYLATNPHTTSGQDTLARELQVFVRDVQRGDLDCFAAPSTRTAVLERRTSSTSEIRIY